MRCLVLKDAVPRHRGSASVHIIRIIVFSHFNSINQCQLTNYIESLTLTLTYM
jgi:hypothetical protein